MVENVFSNLCVPMRHIKVMPFVKMNEDFFYLCRDTIDDVNSINFEVSTIQTYLLDLVKAFFGKGEFGVVGDTTHDLKERIEE